MDMIQTFRIITGIDDLEASDFFTMNHGKKITKQPIKQAELEEIQFLPQLGWYI